MAIKRLENKKHVFWQAFFLALLFMFLGLVLGVYLEQMRVDNTSISFYKSETSLYDSFAIGKLSDNPRVSCEDLKLANINFANQIYDEAVELEKYEESSKITDSLKTLHRKYDMLRTLLWMNIIDVKKKCGNVNTFVYLYEYNTDDIGKKSKQVVWSKILRDLKTEEGDNVMLIPIAVDQNIVSLDYLLQSYGVEEFPAVLINEKSVLYEHQTVDELKGYLE